MSLGLLTTWVRYQRATSCAAWLTISFCLPCSYYFPSLYFCPLPVVDALRIAGQRTLMSCWIILFPVLECCYLLTTSFRKVVFWNFKRPPLPPSHYQETIGTSYFWGWLLLQDRKTNERLFQVAFRLCSHLSLQSRKKPKHICQRRRRLACRRCRHSQA